MVKIKSWPKLIFSILLAQSAGGIGTFFTFDAIPTWYALLNKPVFSPPNWLFGPVWTILYTLIGISLYLIWTDKKGSLKLFLFHLFLNAVWSPIFFGAKNLGLALIVIVMMDITLVIVIKNFYKINKIAGLILIPYLMWITFASMLNLSIWKLNPDNQTKIVFAQDFDFDKSRQDYVYSEDKYKKDLFEYNLKKSSYQQNNTLSLKEELRLSLHKFILSKINFINSYLTMLRMKTVETNGLNQDQKEQIFTLIDTEVARYSKRINDYKSTDNLEDIINKSAEDDIYYNETTLPKIYNTLANLSLSEVVSIKNKHNELYKILKKESEDLIKLGRADSNLFNRWFKDIDQELNLLSEVENRTKTEIAKILSADEYQKDSGYKRSIEEISVSTNSLLKLNGFLRELENILINKR